MLIKTEEPQYLNCFFFFQSMNIYMGIFGWINEFGASEHMIHSAVVCDDDVIT